MSQISLHVDDVPVANNATQQRSFMFIMVGASQPDESGFKAE